MTYFRKRKYHYTGIFLIILFFAVSVYVRKDQLSTPLNRHHEWITAHTLMTIDIWDKAGGPSEYGFSPVYTYPGKGNKNRTMFGGVTDDKGDVYYVSYPPFSFIFAYYFNQVLGGPSVTNMRILSVFLHLICTILLYFLILTAASEEKKDKINIAGVLAGFLYLFSVQNLWGHGNLYFADMLEQALFMVCLILSIRLFRRQYKNERNALILLGLFFFLATYTEWLGVFLAFFTGTAFLIGYFIKKRKELLRSFFVTGFSSAFAIILTVLQFSAIDGFDSYKASALKKYEIRSGHKSSEESQNTFNIHSEEAFEAVEEQYSNGFKMAENFIGISFVLLALALIYSKTRRKIKEVKWKAIMLALLFTSILTHYLLFFNFNSMHDFSSMKTGTLFILFSCLVIQLVSESLNNKQYLALGLLFVPICMDKGWESIKSFNEQYPLVYVDMNKVESSVKMRKLAGPDVAVYSNTPINPYYVYYARHNIFFLNDTAFIPGMMDHFEEDEAQYYHHEGTKLVYMLEYGRNESGEVRLLDRYSFDGSSEENNIHQFRK